MPYYQEKKICLYDHRHIYQDDLYRVLRPYRACYCRRCMLRAESKFGFKFAMVQADNGLDLSRYFERRLKAHSILTRHSRLHRPNDNAHIERFNRTIQDECLGRYITYQTKTTEIQTKLDKYLEFYNTKRVHLSLQYRTPLQMLQSS